MSDKLFDFKDDPDFLDEEEDNETATGGNQEKEEEQVVEEKPMPEIIALARKLAGSPKGLNIDAFFTKYKISYDIETLLNGKLDKDGNLL